tara:strand:+ start:578 stop:757 length:180 start_codon:yes stop_codon:yes gene_type:complete
MLLFDAKEKVNMGHILINLQNKYNFDFREYGFESMKQFIQGTYHDFHHVDGGCISVLEI